MTLLLIRAKLKEEAAAEAEAATVTMFAAVHQANPEGVRYASTKAADGTFHVFLQLDDPHENPLPEIPAWVEFQEDLKQWVAESAAPEPLTVVGSYRLFE
jgi:hypothetical protein